MTKLSETEKKTIVSWNVAVDALLADIEHQRDQILATFGSNTDLRKAYLRAMHRAVMALATFVEPYYD